MSRNQVYTRTFVVLLLTAGLSGAALADQGQNKSEGNKQFISQDMIQIAAEGLSNNAETGAALAKTAGAGVTLLGLGATYLATGSAVTLSTMTGGLFTPSVPIVWTAGTALSVGAGTASAIALEQLTTAAKNSARNMLSYRDYCKATGQPNHGIVLTWASPSWSPIPIISSWSCQPAFYKIYKYKQQGLPYMTIITVYHNGFNYAPGTGGPGTWFGADGTGQLPNMNFKTSSGTTASLALTGPQGDWTGGTVSFGGGGGSFSF